MDEDEGRLNAMQAQLNAILRRVEGLEAGTPTSRPTVGGGERADDQIPGDDEIDFSGTIRRGQERFRAQHRARLSDALAAEPEEVARLFAALGSPFRVRLLRALLDRPHSSQELQAELEVGAAGQLYHHLKELLAARLIVQQRRGVYAIRPEMVMPLCLIFVVAPRLASDPGHGSLSGAPPPPE